MPKDHIGNLIKAARVAQDLSQVQLAEKLGTYQSTVSNWELAKAEPSVTQKKKLQAILGINGKSQAAGGSASAAYGRWLDRERERAGLSVPELADASGISTAAIYNIISGSSANPRESTRKKLERALKRKPPEDVVEVSEESNEVEGLGQLTHFDPHDRNDRPSCAGVYVFYDISERPIYIGKAGNISKRVKDHEEKFWFKAPIVNNAAYIEIKDELLRHQIEQLLIKFLKSNAVINRQSVERE